MTEILTPTPEQSAIIEAAKSTKANLLVTAYAGAAKTSTLVMLCKALPVQPILSLAFNKKIAVEMEKRLPGHVTCKTMNSVGHTVWSRTCTSRLVLDTKKTYNLTSAAVQDFPKSRKREIVRGETFPAIMNAVARAKSLGYIPDGKFLNATRITTRDEWLGSFEEVLDDVVIELAEQVLTASITESYSGRIDFDDQIYMPTLFGGTFPRFPLVLVDEAQDLSPLNHAMLRKLVTSRVIAVGDPFQSIYAFRGAMTSGMEHLRSTFSMTEMPLSVSFRCPREVVRRAWFRVPKMQWPDWAIEGEINELATWTASDIPDGAAIICRNNAPLFRTALDLLRAGRGVQLVGADIGPGLVKVLKSLGPESLTQEETQTAINKWEAERLKKSRSAGSVSDRAECLRVFAAYADSLGGAIAYAEHLFKAEGPILLMSGHKSKGLEFDTVFHLDPWRIPQPYAETPEDLEQEKNISYVILTRAKRRYVEITRDGYYV